MHYSVHSTSEAGRVSGIIIKKITSNPSFKGYTHHASREAPQYLIKRDKTDNLTIHKARILAFLSHLVAWDREFREKVRAALIEVEEVKIGPQH